MLSFHFIIFRFLSDEVSYIYHVFKLSSVLNLIFIGSVTTSKISVTFASNFFKQLCKIFLQSESSNFSSKTYYYHQQSSYLGFLSSIFLDRLNFGPLTDHWDLFSFKEKKSLYLWYNKKVSFSPVIIFINFYLTLSLLKSNTLI